MLFQSNVNPGKIKLFAWPNFHYFTWISPVSFQRDTSLVQLFSSSFLAIIIDINLAFLYWWPLLIFNFSPPGDLCIPDSMPFVSDLLFAFPATGAWNDSVYRKSAGNQWGHLPSLPSDWFHFQLTNRSFIWINIAQAIYCYTNIMYQKYLTLYKRKLFIWVSEWKFTTILWCLVYSHSVN